MATTNEGAILLAIRTRFLDLSALSGGGVSYSASNVYIVDDDTQQQGATKGYATVMLLSAVQPHARSGANIVKATVRLSVYRVNNQDYRLDDRDRITETSYGLMPVLKLIEQYFAQSTLQGILLVPMMLNVMSSLTGTPKEIAPGLVRGYREFNLQYEADIPFQAVYNNGSTPDNGVIIPPS